MIHYHCPTCDLDINKSECSICGGRAEVESKLYWCANCNIPIYDEECPICNEKGTYFTSDARPVFPEERLLLEILLDKPLAYLKESVWNGAGNRYYINGKKIPVSINEVIKLSPDVIRDKLNEYASQNTYFYFDEYMERWVAANAEQFNFITTEAKQYINDFSMRFINNDLNAAFVSFSGGKDSTVVSDLVRKALGNPSIIHIFGNTTLEFPQTYEYIDRFKNTNRKTPVLRAENKEQDFLNLCESFGPPSRSLRWCCTIFKTGFIGDKIKKTFDDRKAILTFYGIRRSESASRNNYERSSKGKKISKDRKSVV
jgi:phosphoadenosine phosphosulfate reductase